MGLNTEYMRKLKISTIKVSIILYSEKTRPIVRIKLIAFDGSFFLKDKNAKIVKRMLLIIEKDVKIAVKLARTIGENGKIAGRDPTA